MIVEKDFLDFLQLLVKNRVRFMVVGGYALAAHHAPRFTGDLDIWIDQERENAENVLKTLNDFGFGSLELTSEDFLAKNYFVQIGYELLWRPIHREK
ncbi:MAG: hypothetical protein ACOYXT_07490 [Bacteroidota bacterium]